MAADSSLKTYHDKRDFGRTPEPAGRVRANAGNRFVVQKHAARRLHYDFRLELDGVLKSWAVTKGPSLDPADKRLAVRTEDHPVDYGNFEGVIPSGYGAGTVMLWDTGTWQPQEDPAAGLDRGVLKFALEGERLKGGFALVRMKNRAGEKRENWLLIKEHDQHADAGLDVREQWTTSITSARDLDEIGAGKAAKKGSRAAGQSAKKKTGLRSPGKSAQKAPQAAGTTAKKATRAAVEARRRSAGASAATAASPAGRRNSPAATGKAAGKSRGKPARKRLEFVPPQLATLRDDPPAGDEWLHELKYDGYRIQALVEDGQVRLITRNGKDWTHRYPQIARDIATLKAQQCIIDGELVALEDSGRSNFGRLQNAVPGGGAMLAYYAFDLLHLDGQSLLSRPLEERKQSLQDLVGRGRGSLRFSSHIVGDGQEIIRKACAMNLEGIISKKLHSRYRSGRTTTWVKAKCIGNDEFVIAGFRESDQAGRAFSSLLLGEYVGGQLVYRGRVGTGFSESLMADLARRMRPLKRSTSPFATTPAEARANAVWLIPRLVAQVAYTEITSEGRLRHPSFLGLREDKEAAEVTAAAAVPVASRQPTKPLEEKQPVPPANTRRRRPRRAAADQRKPASQRTGGTGAPTEVAGVRLTSPDRVMYPEQGATKRAIAEYYARQSQHILPYLQDRPLSFVRCPGGRQGECFFQRHHTGSLPPHLHKVEIVDKSGKSAAYIYLDSAQGLIASAQIGVLELHLWGVRTDRLEHPERVVFDLDPDEEMPFSRVRAAAVEVRDVLRAIGLESFALLTGGKGIHVVAPLVRRRGWDDVKGFARGLAIRLAEAAPGQYVATASKSQRKDRIFIDWLRNERGGTAVAPYSLRARVGAPVATPVSWQELSRVTTAAAWTLDNIERRLARLGADPWEGYFSLRQSITRAHLDAVE